jgi:ribosomal protein S18 acetylase RimI-like enzyme
VGVKEDVPVTDLTLLDRLERCYDAIPRVGGARVEAVGPFDLFLRDGPGWPYYARPRLGATDITPADVTAVLDRQRALGVPLAIEWVLEVTPSLQPALAGSGLSVTLAPLMVLSSDSLIGDSGRAELLDPESKSFGDDFAQSSAVAQLGFGAAGTAVGPVGPESRDDLVRPVAEGMLAVVAAGLRAGHKAEAVVALPGEGIVARGALQSAAGAAEVVGVATLPSARRRGYGAMVSALLARTALARGNDLVFLSAMDDDVARVYGRIGFTRVGTAGIAELDAH